MFNDDILFVRKKEKLSNEIKCSIIMKKILFGVTFMRQLKAAKNRTTSKIDQ